MCSPGNLLFYQNVHIKENNAEVSQIITQKLNIFLVLCQTNYYTSVYVRKTKLYKNIHNNVTYF